VRLQAFRRADMHTAATATPLVQKYRLRDISDWQTPQGRIHYT